MKDKSLSQLIKIADKVFSEVVRRRASWDNHGHINCFVCGLSVHFKDSDAGHCFDRDNLATRFDETNVRAICRTCNRLDTSHRERFRQVLKNEIGDREFYLLEQMAHSHVKFTRSELIDLIQEYKTKLKGLK